MDSFVASLDPSGNVLWATQCEQPGYDPASINGIATDANGNVFVTGTFTGSLLLGADNLGTDSRPDAFVSQMDAADGVFIQSWRMGNSLNDSGVSIATNADGCRNCVGPWLISCQTNLSLARCVSAQCVSHITQVE